MAGSEGQQWDPGWYADPHGRYEARYWDGTAWTDHIMKDGVQGTDVPMGVRSPGVLAPGVVAPGVATPSTFGVGGGAAAPGRGAMASRSRVRQENRAGVGTVLALAGLALYAFSLGQPWIGGTNALTKPPGLFGAANQSWSSFGEALGMGAIALVLTLVFTTLRYQPGGLAGFFYGGIIGFFVLRNKPDRDSPTRRANYMALFVLPLYVIVIWASASSISSDGGYGQLGAGPKLATAAFAVTLAGAVVGRRRVTVQD